MKEFERNLNDIAGSNNTVIDYLKLGEILRRLNFLNNEIDLDNP